MRVLRNITDYFHRLRMFTIFAPSNQIITIMENGTKADALLMHIEHSKPIELSDFVCMLNAVGGLFTSYAGKRGDNKDFSRAKLYVEKIEEGCIDIILCETVTAGLLPFMENTNIIMEFAGYMKRVLGYLINGEGDKPELGLQESKQFKDTLSVTAKDRSSITTIGAINKADKGDVYNGCTFNFYGSNSAQNQLERIIDEQKTTNPSETIHARQLMTIYQMRSNINAQRGNKAVVESLSKSCLPVLFETDDLKERILYSDENPAKKAYFVDVVEMTAGGKVVAYKVIALHEVVDME